MARLQRRRFDDTQDIRVTGSGRVEVVELGERTVARQVWQPGWRWSVDVKPIVGTEYCQSHHVAYAISGRAHIEMSDGVGMDVGPGEVYEIPPGHDAWVLGDEPFVNVDFEALRGFAKAGQDAAHRTLATVLMTDIVDSTARAVAIGPTAWLDVIGRHNRIAERIIDRHEGRLVKTTGDGVIGLFDSAERAVRASLALVEAVTDLDIEVRSAVHAGEVELTADDVRGVVVHTVARMMALAGAGELVVSATIRELVDAGDLAFEDFGLHTLKGLPTERQLYVIRRG